MLLTDTGLPLTGQCRLCVRDVLLPRVLLSILRLIRSPDLAIYELMKDLP
jgi:hypothetical protein